CCATIGEALFTFKPGSTTASSASATEQRASVPRRRDSSRLLRGGRLATCGIGRSRVCATGDRRHGIRAPLGSSGLAAQVALAASGAELWFRCTWPRYLVGRAT